MKSRDQAFDKKYEAYVDHPRYGRYPRHTGLNPNPDDPKVQLHGNASSLHETLKRMKRILGKGLGIPEGVEDLFPKELPRIAGTAINATPAKQNRPTVAVTHYYDVESKCRDCQRPFIFFAEEQRHWYETLQFPLYADCVRCPECRQTERTLVRHRAAYEKLVVAKERDWKDNLKMAECAVTLVEHGIFHRRVLEKARSCLKSVPETERAQDKYLALLNRVKQFRPAKKPL